MGSLYYLVAYRCYHYCSGDNYDTYHNDVIKGPWIDFFRELHGYNQEEGTRQKYVFLNALEITEEEFKEFEGHF